MDDDGPLYRAVPSRPLSRQEIQPEKDCPDPEHPEEVGGHLVLLRVDPDDVQELVRRHQGDGPVDEPHDAQRAVDFAGVHCVPPSLTIPIASGSPSMSATLANASSRGSMRRSVARTSPRMQASCVATDSGSSPPASR